MKKQGGKGCVRESVSNRNTKINTTREDDDNILITTPPSVRPSASSWESDNIFRYLSLDL